MPSKLILLILLSANWQIMLRNSEQKKAGMKFNNACTTVSLRLIYTTTVIIVQQMIFVIILVLVHENITRQTTYLGISLILW